MAPAFPKTSQIRVLIAEDHQLTRNGLVYTLEKSKNFIIVGEVDNGEKARSLALSEKPDIVLMDIGMPILDGLTATQRIKAAAPEIKVIILTSYQKEEQVLASLAGGADAYCLKDTPVDLLVRVISIVHEGGIWLDPAIAKMVMQALPNTGGKIPPSSKERKRYNTNLTERELDVLREIVAGKNNKEISEALDISLHTVKAHVCSIIQKLSVDDRTQAAIKALKEELV